MPYAQRNYRDIQGINGKYTIAQIGCFLTSFCNLLERFGMGVAPNQLNQIFKERGIFIDVDDGVRDDLGWQSVTAYNGQIVTTVKSGGVTDRNSIVRLDARNSFGTHFCLVDSIRADGVYILDSYDGVVKHHNAYGPITGWAVYTHNKPQPVGVINVIPDKDNYYGRYNKEMNLKRGRDISGKGFSRDEFRKNIVGLTDLQATERISDDVEADQAHNWMRVGYTAVKDNWQGQITARDKQIADLKVALANEKAKPPVEVIKEVEKIVEKEVIKEIPVAADEKVVVENWLKRLWNNLFKKG